MPYNKLLTYLACLSRTVEYWPSAAFVRTSLHSVTATISDHFPQYGLRTRLVRGYNLLTFRLRFSVFRNHFFYTSYICWLILVEQRLGRAKNIDFYISLRWRAKLCYQSAGCLPRLYCWASLLWNLIFTRLVSSCGKSTR